MGSKLESGNLHGGRTGRRLREEIVSFAAYVGASDCGSAEIRRRVVPELPARTWHRVFPFLPKERRGDGAIVVWHPAGDDWSRALDHVHARRPIAWRRSGAYLQLPESEALVLADLVDFDDLQLSDWSLAVPDPRFGAFCRASDFAAPRLSEMVARWALQTGPREAGRLLGARCRLLAPAVPGRPIRPGVSVR